MPRPKFSDNKLKQLVNDGLNCTQIAKRLGVTKGAVSQRLKALNLAASKEIALCGQLMWCARNSTPGSSYRRLTIMLTSFWIC
jgi:hypothetical protein